MVKANKPTTASVQIPVNRPRPRGHGDIRRGGRCPTRLAGDDELSAQHADERQRYAYRNGGAVFAGPSDQQPGQQHPWTAVRPKIAKLVSTVATTEGLSPAPQRPPASFAHPPAAVGERLGRQAASASARGLGSIRSSNVLRCAAAHPANPNQIRADIIQRASAPHGDPAPLARKRSFACTSGGRARRRRSGRTRLPRRPSRWRWRPRPCTRRPLAQIDPPYAHAPAEVRR